MDDIDPFSKIEGGHALAQAIVDTIREPLLVLDADLRVVAASRSFYATFAMTPGEVEGRFVYTVGDSRWDIPELRVLLERVLPDQAGLDSYEVSRTFGETGPRTMLLNARTVFFEGNAHKMILLAMEDVTVWRSAEKAMKDLLREKEVLLEEMQHRVANSLQIIASILMLKARGVQSEETRQHLQDAHQRVMSVAAVQEELKGSRHGEAIELAPYLTRLCEKLGASMIVGERTIALKVHATASAVLSKVAVSIGLIITELVINSVKHAFPANTPEDQIAVEYGLVGAGWRLSVTDNGCGMSGGADGAPKAGLGTSLIEALARRLNATVEVRSGPDGTRVAIRHDPSATLPDHTLVRVGSYADGTALHGAL